ncbi:MAG TPA: CHAP domain-containing protein [Candidatus Limnocylindria bacterium]|nr:CHAP domain-containing protein [Candidatus Limnocylindria bacterium]
MLPLAVVALVLLAGASDSYAETSESTPLLTYGVSDDSGKYADDGGAWFYGQLRDAGLSQTRWTLRWDPTAPAQIEELSYLQRAAPLAAQNGIRVVLALYSQQPSQHDPDAFCDWAGRVAQTVAQWNIHEFVVWNEPNTRRFWTPQKDQAGQDVGAPAYEALLARCYDVIHAADPAATVVGMSLSPRASTPESNEPLTFLRDVGSAYRASGRAAPIMDQLALHPYPNPSSPTDAPNVGYQDPTRFGIPNLDRVKQAVYEAFNGTPQPTTSTGLTLRIDEISWQVNTDPGDPRSSPDGSAGWITPAMGYFNDENVAVVDQRQQADYLQTAITQYLACDPSVTDISLLPLQDESSRNGRDPSGTTVLGGGWQSGLLTAGSPGKAKQRLAYGVVAQLAHQGRAACTGPTVATSPVAPTIKATVTGTLGKSGWYRSTVNVSWTVTPAPGYPISSPPCITVSIDKDTKGTTLTCQASSMGAAASQAVTIKRDATPPSLKCQSASFVYGQPSAAVSASVSDATSGPTQSRVSKGAKTTTAETTGRRDPPFNGKVTLVGSDKAGNSAKKSCAYTVKSYPWMGAVQLNAKTSDYGYTKCPSDASRCMLQTYRYNGKVYGEYDAWLYYFRNCTSYVAWRLRQAGVSSSKLAGLGNGGWWYDRAPAHNLKRGTTPKVGAAAVKAGTPGHVAYVEAKYADGTIRVSEYNKGLDGRWGTRRGTPSALQLTKFVYFG